MDSLVGVLMFRRNQAENAKQKVQDEETGAKFEV